MPMSVPDAQRHRARAAGGGYVRPYLRRHAGRHVLVALFALALGGLPWHGLRAQDTASVPAADRSAGQAPGDSLTLQEAIREASAYNAHLPIAASNVAIARARLREAQGRLFPRLLVDGDIHNGVPQSYATGDARLQLVGVDTLLGAGRRATRAVSRLEVSAAVAGYRATERDVQLNVRLWFSAYQQAASEIAFREAGLELLRRYLAVVQSLQASGQGTNADVLRTRVRLGTEEADVSVARNRLDDARFALNELMGRVPDSPLVLANQPAPAAPQLPAGEPWRATPDVQAAQAVQKAAQAAIGITRAERSPQLSVAADIGAQPLLGPAAAGSPLNNGRGAGAEITLGFTIPLWDAGVYRARLTQARLIAQQAGDSATVVLRESRLAWQRAAAELTRLYGEVQTRAQTLPIARDSYLLAESTYRGGAGTSLEVLDAYTAWIAANQAYSDAVLRYRQAQAQFIRWGTP